MTICSQAEERVTTVKADFESFVRESSTRLLRTAILLCGNRTDADDLVQTAYTAAFRRWRLVANAESPVAYTRRILIRAYLADQKRARQRAGSENRTARSAATSDSLAGASRLEPVDARISLLEAIATLPTLDRAVVIARYWEDLSVGETAALLNLTEGACRTRASRALARLRRQFPDLED